MFSHGLQTLDHPLYILFLLVGLLLTAESQAKPSLTLTELVSILTEVVWFQSFGHQDQWTALPNPSRRISPLLQRTPKALLHLL